MWGTSWESDGEVDNIVWGSSSEEDNITWGCAGAETPLFDDPDVPSEFDGSPETFESLFSAPVPVPAEPVVVEPPPALEPETTVLVEPVTTVIGGGL